MTTFVSPRAHHARTETQPNQLGTLAGATLGLFTNHKPNSELLLDALSEGIDARVGLAGVVRVSKRTPAEAAPDEVYDQLAEQCQAVIFASADCGSCTTWGVHDVAQLEQRGVPTVCMTGHSFKGLAEAYAESLGFPARIVVFEHPIAGRGEAEVRTKAETLIGTVIESFLGVAAAVGV
jgi:hypothetical protein